MIGAEGFNPQRTSMPRLTSKRRDVLSEPAYLQNIGGGFFQGGADKQMFWRLCSVFVRGLEAGGPISAYLSYISALLC
ncbi:hypothetical protein M8J75_015685 [Diaphorina citri]|nr:hypothetical protein M8J75_015685 [Diaphorina citri]